MRETDISLEEFKDRSSNKFVPGSIHTDDKLSYWKDTLRANQWVIDTLKFGYCLPLTSVPSQYEEQNNLSAKENMQFVRQEVQSLVEQGVVEIVKQKPLCVSPLTVAIREKSDGQVKRRLCWDGSRHINLRLQEQKVNLSHLGVALETSLEGDFQLKYDLKSAFHHIKMHKNHVQYLGAAYQDEKGATVYFIFLYLPFGAASAVHCITKMLKPVVAHLAQKGIRHTIFIDDGRVSASSLEMVRQHFTYTISVLCKAGWQISWAKTDNLQEASFRKEYLGFIIDTEQMRVFLTEEKKTTVTNSINNLLDQFGEKVKSKTLAKTLGQMISLEPALGGFPLTFARLAYYELEQTVDKFGWKSYLKISQQALRSLEIFINQINEFDGAMIKTAATAVSVISIIGPPSLYLKNKTIPNHVKELPKEIWCGDASDAAVCAYSINTGKDTYFIGKLSPEECKLSSGGRELITVKKALEAQSRSCGPWKENILLYWLTDSTNLVTFLTKGSTKPAIQAIVVEVLILARSLNCTLQPIHLLRDDPRITIADAGSKAPDTDDWSVDQATFTWLSRELGPFTIDCFADESNKKVPRFFSNFLCPTSLGIDAFSHSWDYENCWICPPVKSILSVTKKLSKVKGKGVLIVPKWTTASFWPFLFPDGQNLSPIFQGVMEFNPDICQNQRARSVISGKTTFPFLALYYFH